MLYFAQVTYLLMCRFLLQLHPRPPHFQALKAKGNLSRISPMEMVGTAYCAVKSKLSVFSVTKHGDGR